jgi:hypothetical protein
MQYMLRIRKEFIGVNWKPVSSAMRAATERCHPAREAEEFLL